MRTDSTRAEERDDSEKLAMRLPRPLVIAIDRWRHREGVVTRSSAVRELLRRGLRSPVDNQDLI